MNRVPKLYAAELKGIDAELIEVEADLNVGLHSFNIVGLADKAVNEARERINSALKHSGTKPPTKENRKITVNLAPADIKKVGSHFDLSIAVAYLLASNQLKQFETKNKIFIGELSLDGEVRPVKGCLSIALLAQRAGIKSLFVPRANADEAAIISNIEVIPVSHLRELIEHLEDINPIKAQPISNLNPSYPPTLVSLDEIKGLESAKRALLIAAAGNHHILMSGPPGAGKTMLAQAITSILPPPSQEEIIEITQIYSAAHIITGQKSIINYRPFRAPHHSASIVAIIGGGSNPKPGEISLAHRGVLFLDEIPEFHRDVLESLRQPLEAGIVHIARSKKTLNFPARFTLVAAMNPCPCGYFNDSNKECVCTANQIFRYQRKISGPLLDRIDIQIEVPRIKIEELQQNSNVKAEAKFRSKVSEARLIQKERFASRKLKIYTNSEMSSKMIDEIIILEPQAESFLKQALEREFISARGYYRILKIAQTIADLEATSIVKKEYLAEAFQYKLKTNE